MKKYFFFSVLFLFSFSISGQEFQNMVLLPSSMHIGSDINSMCISLFSKSPDANTHFKIDGRPNSDVSITGRGTGNHASLNVHGNVGNQSTFLLSGDTRIDDRLKTFVSRKINEFSYGNFDKTKYVELQNQIWSYNVLDKYGYLTHYGDEISDFNQGVNKFCEEYMIDDLLSSFSKEDVEKKMGRTLSDQDYREIKNVLKYDEIKEIGYSIHDRHQKYNLEGKAIQSNVYAQHVEFRAPEYNLTNININYNKTYPGENNIISNNKYTISTDVKRFYIDNAVPKSIKIVPADYSHQNHFLIIYDKDNNPRKFKLPNNSHTTLYKKAVLDEC